MHSLKSVLKVLLIVGAIMLLATFIVMVVLRNYDDVANARQILERVSLSLMVIRLGAMATVWFFWNNLVDGFYKDATNEAAMYLKARRTNIVLLFVVIELLLVQNVVGELWGVIM